MTRVFIRGEEKNTQGKYHVKKEAEIVIMHLQTKERQGLPAITSSQEERHGLGSPSQPSEGTNLVEL